MKKYIIKVEPLTAVHIGTGREIDPMEYTIVNGKYIRFSAERVIGALNEEQKTAFNELIEKEQYKEVALFLHKHITPASTLYQAEVSSSIEVSFNKHKNSFNNSLYVEEMYRNMGNNKAVIPGSSLKGAIRTAILSNYGLKIPKSNDRMFYKKPLFEQNILKYSDAKNDPFRAVRLSDCQIDGEKCQYVGDFVNFKENRKKGDDFARMSIRKELIIGELLNGDANGICELTIDSDLQNIKKSFDKWAPIERKIGFEEIVQYCNDFYIKNFNDEFEKFYLKSRYPEMRKNGEILKSRIEKINPGKGECLIRVGRFSQAENVTVENHREPWNNKGYGATRTITEDCFPAGFVKLTFVSFKEYWQIEKKRRQGIELKSRAEAERRKVEEEQIKAEKERIANMSDDEKMIEEIVKCPDDTNDIGLVVNKCLNEEYSADVFKVLKEMLENHGEWKPYGSKQKKMKMQKRNEKIEAKI